MSESHDRPLLTFALFAYNQEKFIREAVRGAFAQTYEPLEIILSDDCSTDRTFEIMQQMAAAYEGRHRVVVNKTSTNAGILSHLIDTCKLAQGDIIVVAAGDDISYPQRVQRVAREFRGNPTAYCVTSGFDLIDEDGLPISEGLPSPARMIRSFLTLPQGMQHTVIQGSTAAYRRDVFMFKFPEPLLDCAEDNLLNFMIYANGKSVMSLPVALVAYRQHQNALANFAKSGLSARQAEIASMTRHFMRKNLLLSIRSVAETCTAPERVNKSEIAMVLRNTRERICWGRLSTRKRLALVLRALRSREFLQLAWQLPRLWGRFPDYLPNSYTRPLELLLDSRVRSYLQRRNQKSPEWF